MTMDYYDRPEKEHIRKPHFCYECKKGFGSLSALADHDKSKHGAIPDGDLDDRDPGIDGIADDLLTGGQE